MKLEKETDYVQEKITRTVDLSSITNESPLTLTVNVKAEDGTEKEYNIYVYRKAELGLLEVNVNTEIIPYNEQDSMYKAVVPNANKPQVVITAKNEKQTVQLLDLDENVIASGIGTLTTTLTLQADPLESKYIIKVISHNGEESGKEFYDFSIRQKAKETGIMYIKVDGSGTIQTGDTYKATVSGKEKYPVEIKLKDTNAKVRIEDLEGNILVTDQTGILNGELAIPDGETKDFKVIVTSENGEEKEYTLTIERISSNLNLESITVTDYDTDGVSIITKQVTSYDKDTKTYKVFVNRNLSTSDITIKTISEFTDIEVDSITKGKETISYTKALKGLGVTEVVIKLRAADGTEETRYLHIVQLSDEIGLIRVEVDGVEVTAKADGDYEYTVSNKVDLSSIKAVTVADTSRVSINGKGEAIKETEVNVSKGNLRKQKIPIKVTAEDGTEYTYYLILNIISSDNGMQKVNVEGEEASLVDGKYIGYIDPKETEANIEIIAKVEYSEVIYETEDGEIRDKEKITFKYDTSELDTNEYTVPFKVIAEDGEEASYELIIIRKSEDNSIKEVYVDEKEIAPNVGHDKYADGTYYAMTINNTAKVKIVTGNEFARITFNGKTGTNSLEQTITLNANSKVTEVPVTITSQAGTTYETTIYIEKVSNDNSLVSVKVNSEEAERSEEEQDTFIGYIYDTMTSARVEIEANHEFATVTRCDKEGHYWLDEHGLAVKGTKKLVTEIDTPDNITEMYFKIIAENGEESQVYKLIIEKMSTDATLKELYVNGELLQPRADGNYEVDILDIKGNPDVKAVTNHNKAHVRIALGEERLHITEETPGLSPYKQTTIPITVRSQSGITQITYLYINRISTKVEIDVTLDDKEADGYNEQTHTFTFLIEDTKEDFEMFAVAESEYTLLEYEGHDYQGSFREIVHIEKEIEGKSFKIKATSETGIEQEYTVDVVHKSDNTNLDFLKVNDVLREPDEEGGDTYTVMVPKLAETVLFEVQTEHGFAHLRLGDNNTVKHYDKATLDCNDLSMDRIVVPIVVTAPDGVTIRTYNVILIRGDNNTDIELTVNTEKLTPNEEGNYEISLPETIDKIDILAEVIKEEGQETKTKVDLNSTGKPEIGLKEITLDKEYIKDKEMIEIPIEVIAEDGTTKNKTLTIKLLKGTYITGKITTENVNGEHITDITVYRLKETVSEAGETIITKEKVTTLKTEIDGTFKALIYMTGIDNKEVLQDKYEVVVSKLGYLDYTVTKIEIEEGQETELDTYKLLAGDIVKTGEIELDDLVHLNEKIGITINHINGVSDANEIYDLNEDGQVDILDRNILKKNYTKKAKIVEWINPNKETKMKARKTVNGFIIPIEGEYRITSEYGVRIHPITGKETKHKGIDISGTHHAEVMAVEAGEVIYSGVQKGYGNCIEVKHIVNGETIYTFYAHLSERKVEVGDKVVQGEVIGKEGGDPETDPNPGTSTGHHLHFEVRIIDSMGQKVNVDPNMYIKF